MHVRGIFAQLCILALATIASADEAAVNLQTSDTTVTVRVNSVEMLRYVFRDPAISRPYFAPVQTLSGQQVSRNHPPQDDFDKTDHPSLHTGIWLSFGDLNGHDYWRLKARTEHVRLLEAPAVTSGVGSWSVLNRYLSTNGQETVCEETARYSIRLLPQGYLLDMTSEFRPVHNEIVFGDQEEMGIGMRLHSPLAVDQELGGRILDSQGRRNGGQVWGHTSDWCDYSGPLGGKWAGMTILSHPKNFRSSWNHARDYGFLAVNPFGRAAFTQGEPSRVVVKPGEVLSLRFGIYVHESTTEADCSIADTYRLYTRQPADPSP